MAVRDTPDTKEQIAKQLAQNLRNDFHLLSTEARKKYPAVREVRNASNNGCVGTIMGGIIVLLFIVIRKRSNEIEAFIRTAWIFAER
jgi:hypothetical protein